MLYVEVETASSPASWCTCKTQEDVDYQRRIELENAKAECAKRAEELALLDTVKAAELDAAAKDEKLTAYELWGAVKVDGREGTKPPGETDTKPKVGESTK